MYREQNSSTILLKVYIVVTVPISRTNAYAQAHLIVYFYPADKRKGSVIYIIAQLTIIITYESYLSRLATDNLFILE
jgi:hypothetical protein